MLRHRASRTRGTANGENGPSNRHVELHVAHDLLNRAAGPVWRTPAIITQSERGDAPHKSTEAVTTYQGTRRQTRRTAAARSRTTAAQTAVPPANEEGQNTGSHLLRKRVLQSLSPDIPQEQDHLCGSTHTCLIIGSHTDRLGQQQQTRDRKGQLSYQAASTRAKNPRLPRRTRSQTSWE